jgi:hypothetical protein
MSKAALKTIAKLSHVNVREAVNAVRKNPLLGDEIHIDEELINLEEAMHSYRLATENLIHYPTIKAHLHREKRDILKHCFGLIIRMVYNKRLPHAYDINDTRRAIRRLVQLVVEDMRRSKMQIDQTSVDILFPLLNVRQRLQYGNMSVRAILPML